MAMMKLTFRRIVAAGLAVTGVFLIFAGLVFSAMWAVAAGFALLILCLMAVTLFVYRHVVNLLGKVDRLQVSSDAAAKLGNKANAQVSEIHAALSSMSRFADEVSLLSRRQSAQHQDQEAALRRIGMGLAALEQVARQSQDDLASLVERVDARGKDDDGRLSYTVNELCSKVDSGNERVAIELAHVKEQLAVIDAALDAWLAEEAPDLPELPGPVADYLEAAAQPRP